MDVAAAARQVIQDWNDGTLRYFTLPPPRNTHVEGSAAVLTEWGREFDLEDVQEGEMAMVEGLPSLDDEEGAQVDSIGAPLLEPLEAMEEEREGSEEEEDGMDEGEGGPSWYGGGGVGWKRGVQKMCCVGRSTVRGHDLSDRCGTRHCTKSCFQEVVQSLACPQGWQRRRCQDG